MRQPTARLHPSTRSSRQLQFTASARRAVQAACRSGSRQAILLSWPAGVTYLPGECYQQTEFDVVVGHVAGCPIYADIRQLALFPDRRVLVDAEPSFPSRSRPALRARAMPEIASDTRQESFQETRFFDLAAARVTGELVQDLDERFAGKPTEAIRGQVRGAIRDLRGSVNVDALPEMAARLASQRLSEDIPAPEDGV